MRHDPILCHRLMFALRPPAPVLPSIGALFDLPDMKGRRMPSRSLHLAIDILEDSLFYPARAVRAALDAGGQVMFDPFEIVLDRLVAGQNMVALRPSRRLAPLQQLHEAVRAARIEAGLPDREGYRFAPHITLVRRDGAPFSRQIEPIRWMVDELVLIDGLIGSARYDIVGRWRMESEAPPPSAPRQYALL